MKYDPKAIEPKWQKYWDEHGTFRARDFSGENPKYFPLVEFPYPSGAGLHVGHPRPYTAMDVIARKRRMEGYNVLYPIGWDAFGLPTENYAIKTGRPPAEVTAENIANFTRQIKSLGISFDWSRQVDTTDPKYYKWTQWIFLQLFKRGLAYKAAMPINWCLNCKIGLANEEVVDGRCERCGGPVEKRNKEQWMLAITKYADRLLEDLDTVDYITPAKIQQKNWIGRSEGAEIEFGIKNHELRIKVFTTRPDTIFGATYLVIAPEHNIIEKLKSEITNWAEVEAYLEATRKKTDLERSALDKEKSGVELHGIAAINPATGEEIPVWMADYVLDGYGTGAIMAVPAHDERDWEFARKFGLPIKQVVAPFIKLTGVEAPRPDKSTVEKKVVSAIIKMKDSDRYLLLKWSSDVYGLVGGGIEADEDAESAIIREIEEETGYKNAQIKSVIYPSLYSQGYKHRKDTNCFDLDKFFLVEVSDDQLGEIREEDQGAHEIVWVNKNEVVQKITKNHHRFVWDCYQQNRFCFTESGIVVDSDFLNTLTSEDAKEKIIQWLEEKGIGTRKVQYKLRDWVFSRQRYWGEPIPLVHCAKCAGWVPLPEDQLPLELPKVEKYQPTDTGESPLATMTDWVNTTCPQCGGPARRETDTMPNWAGSSWYFLRYLAPHDDDFFTKRQAWKRPALEPNEHDQLVRESFLKIREIFKKADVRFWICGSLLMNALNREQWVHMDDIDIHVHGADYERAIATLTAAGLTENKRREGSVEMTHGEVDIELIAVWNEGDSDYSYYSNGQKIKLAQNDLEMVERGSLFGVTFRTVSPWHALYQYTYLQKYFEREKEGDGNKRQFLTDYISDPVNYWMGVDWYNGGMEHTVLHLLYSRFWNKFLFDIGVSPVSEPYNKRTSHGLILAKGGEKMSKSKGNVVNPDEIVDQFGADTLRAYIMFMGPFDQAVEWDTNGLVGVRRFLERVWNLRERVAADAPESKDDERVVHNTIRELTHGLENMHFNTGVSHLMILANQFASGQLASGDRPIKTEHYEKLLLLLSVFAPHLAEELWQQLGHTTSIAHETWPTYDEAKARGDEVIVVIQVNGKVRDQLTVSPDIAEAEITAAALASEKVQKWLEGREPKKVIYVKGKLVSIVV